MFEIRNGFIRESFDIEFRQGECLPERALKNVKPVWVTKLSEDEHFSRQRSAQNEGLRSAFAFPIISRTEVYGVMEFYSREIRSSDDELLRFVDALGTQIGFFFDTKLAEIALKESLEMLEDKVSERTTDLKAAVRMREELVAMVSHDLKSPLSVILASVGALQRAKDDKRGRWLNLIEGSAKNMANMITNLLDLHKLEAGLFKVDKANNDLGALIDLAVASLLPIADEKEIILQKEVPTSLPQILVDAQQIGRVFQNLISNAIKFSSKGGIILLKLIQDNERLLFSIKDNGPGISKEMLPQIFDRFSQARETSSLGTGLGLAISKGIVTAHGGMIWAESKVGEGSTFYFSLPLAIQVPCAKKRNITG